MFAYAGISRKSIIVSINHIPTPTLDAFVNAVKTLPDQARVPVRYYNIAKVYQEKVAVVHVDRSWHPFRMATRNGKGIVKRLYNKAILRQ